MVVVWGAMLVAGRCLPGALLIDFALGAGTVCIALWASHLRARPVDGWKGVLRIAGGALYDVLFLIVLIVVSVVALRQIVPQYSCSPLQAKAAQVILYGSAYRAEIGERAARLKSLAGSGGGLKVKPGGRVKGGYISRDGLIILVSDDPPVFVVLAPRMQDGTIAWACSGMPVRLMPASCRDEIQF